MWRSESSSHAFPTSEGPVEHDSSGKNESFCIFRTDLVQGDVCEEKKHLSFGLTWVDIFPSFSHIFLYFGIDFPSIFSSSPYGFPIFPSRRRRSPSRSRSRRRRWGEENDGKMLGISQDFDQRFGVLGDQSQKMGEFLFQPRWGIPSTTLSYEEMPMGQRSRPPWAHLELHVPLDFWSPWSREFGNDFLSGCRWLELRLISSKSQK